MAFEIFTVPAVGGTPFNLTNNTTNEADPSWSPDGKKIVYVSLFNGTEVWVINVANGTLDNSITDNPAANDVFPARQPNTAPPAVTSPSPRADSTVKDRTPFIAATVGDAQDDLATANIKLYVGNKPKPFNYFAGADRLTTSSVRVGAGRHTVRMVARDASGRVGSRTWSFRRVVG